MSKYLYLGPNKFGNYFPDLFGGVDYGRRSEELVQSLPFEGRQIMVYNINIQSHISKGNESRTYSSQNKAHWALTSRITSGSSIQKYLSHTSKDQPEH